MEVCRESHGPPKGELERNPKFSIRVHGRVTSQYTLSASHWIPRGGMHFAYVLVLKGVGPSEELLVQKEKKYSLGTSSSGRHLYTIPFQNVLKQIVSE